MFQLVTGLIARAGAGGVFLLMLLENVVPVIPSELILPMAGFQTARGDLSWTAAVVAGTAGSVLGALGWYWLGLRLGIDRLERWSVRHGRWLTMTPAELRRADGWFRRWGPWAVAIGRCLPGVRGVICIPAGVAGMRLAPFLLSCTAGSLAWCVLLVQAGRALGAHYDRLGAWLNPVSTVFFVGCLAIYLLRVLTFRPTPAAQPPTAQPPTGQR